MRGILVLLALLSGPVDAPAGVPPDTIRGMGEGAEGGVAGTVLAERPQGIEPLARALVEVRTSAGTASTHTDEGGRYRVDGLPPGPALVRASHLGFQGHLAEVEVAGGEVVSLDLELRSRPVELSPVHVEGRRVRVPHAVEPTARRESRDPAMMEALAAVLGFPDPGLTAAARNLPPDAGDRPGDVLFMRGSTTDLRRVLLDGAPVFSPFHLAGLVPSFQGDLLGDAGSFIGGAPTHYDGTLSHVLDLRTRQPRNDRLHLSGGVDGMSARMTAEGPIGSTGRFLAGGRALHDLQPRLARDGRSPYGYRDLLVRAEQELAPGHVLTLSQFWNRESVRLDREAIQAEVRDMDGFRGRAPTAAPGEAVWGNRATSLRYTGRLAGQWTRATLGRSLYRAALPLDLENPVFVRGWAESSRAALDMARDGDRWDLRWGGVAEEIRLTFAAPGVVDATAHQGGAGEGREVVGTGGRSGGVYLEGRRPLGEEFALSLGGRLDGFSAARLPRVSPRVSGEWRLTDDARLTVTVARYHQQVPSGSEEALAMALEESEEAIPVHWRPDLTVASSSHLVVALGQDLTESLRMDLTGFGKRFDGLGDVPSGRLDTSGVDLRVLRDGERLRGWLGYTLTWFWAGGETPTREFAGRHLLAGGVDGRLGGFVDLRLSAIYGAGLPYTGVPLLADGDIGPTPEGDGTLSAPTGTRDASPPLAVEPVGDFLRVDLEARGHWELELGGRSVTLRPYARVLNALDRRDALFLYFDRWRDEEARPLAERPFLPLVGVEWTF